MMKALFFVLILAVMTRVGLFSSKPLDRLSVNLNINDSPRGRGEAQPFINPDYIDSNLCEKTPHDVQGPFYVKKEYTLETKCIAFSAANSSPDKCGDKEYKKEPVQIKGKIMDTKCNPIDGAIIEYWQTAPKWSETHPKLYTMVDSTCTGIDGTGINGCVDTSNEQHLEMCEAIGHTPDCIADIHYKAYRGWQKSVDGNYELHTVRPGIYDGRPIRHIHIKISVPGKTIDGEDYLITQLYLPQDEPEEGDETYESYISNCENYRILPGQWAKKQELDICPVRNEPDGSIVGDLTVYNWDVVLNI